MSNFSLTEDLRSTTYRFVRRLNTMTPADDLSPRHRIVLASLDTNNSLTSADIARQERISPQAVNLAVSQLADKGLIVRRTHSTDRRRHPLDLTAEGRQLIHQVRDHKNAWIDDQVATLTSADRETLQAALSIMRSIIDRT